jgi:hypothetical protein
MVLGELSKNVWEVATVLWPNSRYLSFGGERINGYSPLVIRTAVRGAVGRPTQMGAPWRWAQRGPMRCG